VGVTGDSDMVTSPPTRDARGQWRGLTVEWSTDGDTAAPELDLRTPREGCAFDPDDPGTWLLCQTPACGDEMVADSGRFTDGRMDYDVVRCYSCGFEAHV
jgi:hypothetical protein